MNVKCPGDETFWIDMTISMSAIRNLTLRRSEHSILLGCER